LNRELLADKFAVSDSMFSDVDDSTTPEDKLFRSLLSRQISVKLTNSCFKSKMGKGKYLEYRKTATLRYNAVALNPLSGEMREKPDQKLIIIIGRFQKFNIQDMTPPALQILGSNTGNKGGKGERQKAEIKPPAPKKGGRWL
jgi:hypothetical protein